MSLGDLLLSELDARVLAALWQVPDEDPIERLAAVANVPLALVRPTLRRLALRSHETLPARGDA